MKLLPSLGALKYKIKVRFLFHRLALQYNHSFVGSLLCTFFCSLKGNNKDFSDFIVPRHVKILIPAILRLLFSVAACLFC